MAFVDIDFLKQVNHGLGHEAGDRAIADVATAAESELIHFGSRSVGGLGGAAIGAGVGGASTSWSGPGLFVGGGVGRVIGVLGGQKFADWTDNRNINQEDRSGNTCTFDPNTPIAAGNVAHPSTPASTASTTFGKMLRSRAR